MIATFLNQHIRQTSLAPRAVCSRFAACHPKRNSKKKLKCDSQSKMQLLEQAASRKVSKGCHEEKHLSKHDMNVSAGREKNHAVMRFRWWYWTLNQNAWLISPPVRSNQCSGWSCIGRTSVQTGTARMIGRSSGTDQATGRRWWHCPGRAFSPGAGWPPSGPPWLPHQRIQCGGDGGGQPFSSEIVPQCSRFPNWKVRFYLSLSWKIV